MPSQELQRIIRDLSQFGDTITISAIKNSIQFRYSEISRKSFNTFLLSVLTEVSAREISS